VYAGVSAVMRAEEDLQGVEVSGGDGGAQHDVVGAVGVELGDEGVGEGAVDELQRVLGRRQVLSFGEVMSSSTS
jgi:hypothetical protein